MSKKSRSQIEVETNFIRQYMENNLKLGLTHEDIIKQLGISRSTYYRHVRRIHKEYEKVWNQCYAQSAVYYASQLVQRLEECINLCKSIRDNPNEIGRYAWKHHKICVLLKHNCLKSWNLVQHSNQHYLFFLKRIQTYSNVKGTIKRAKRYLIMIFH